MNLANKLTFLRFLLSPLVAFFYHMGWNATSSFLFLVAIISDCADGYVAKRMNAQSDLGRDLDPLADKFLSTFILGIILSKSAHSPWVVWSGTTIIVREIFVTGLRSIVGGAQLPVVRLSKIKTFVQFLSIGMFLVPSNGSAIKIFSTVFLVGSAVLSVMTAFYYVVRFFHLVKDN